MTFDPGPPPAEAATDDHVLATWLATVAGARLLEVRTEGLEGKELKDAGDVAAHDLLMELLAEHRPDDAVLSEEGPDERVDKVDRLTASRVWIIDPLDGTREFSEPPRDDWAVHVALWEDGDLVAGAREPDLELPLQHRRRSELGPDHELGRLFQQIVVVAEPILTLR